MAAHVSEDTFNGYIDVKMRVAERAVHDNAQADLQTEIDRINKELRGHNIQVRQPREWGWEWEILEISNT